MVGTIILGVSPLPLSRNAPSLSVEMTGGLGTEKNSQFEDYSSAFSRKAPSSPVEMTKWRGFQDSPQTAFET